MNTSKNLTSVLAIVTTLGGAFLPMACAEEPIESTETETASASQHLFSRAGITLWTANKNAISACFSTATANDASLATWRSDIASFLIETTRRANVSISGFGACQGSPGAGNVIISKIPNQGNSNASVGYYSGGADTINYGNDSATGSAPIRGRRNVIIHEFMHILGYDHEFNRMDTDGCYAKDSGTWTGGTNWTPNYDHDSILNSTYCHSNANLTFLDVGGMRVGYGAPIKLSNRVSGYCLEVPGNDSHGAGTQVDVYNCDVNASDPKLDEQWDVRPTSGGYFNLVNKYSNLCLGVNGVDNHGTGAAVEVYYCGANSGDPKVDQEWTWQLVAYNRYKLVNRLHGYCLSMPGIDSHSLGSGVEVQSCSAVSGDSRNDEQWTVNQSAINTNAVRIIDSIGGYCIGVQGIDSHGPGAAAEIYSCDVNSSDFKRDGEWTLENTTDGYFRIKNQSSSLCLGVVGVDSHGEGALIEAYYCDPDAYDARRDGEWKWYDVGGKRRLQNRVSGLCLYGVGYSQGSTLQTHDCATADFWVVE